MTQNPWISKSRRTSAFLPPKIVAFNQVLTEQAYAPYPKVGGSWYEEKPPVVLFLMTLGALLGLLSLLGVSVGVIVSMLDDRATPNAPGTAPRMPSEFA